MHPTPKLPSTPTPRPQFSTATQRPVQGPGPSPDRKPVPKKEVTPPEKARLGVSAAQFPNTSLLVSAAPSKEISDINRQTPPKAGAMAPSDRRVGKSNQKPRRPETAKLDKSLEQELMNPPKFRVRLPASVPFELYVLPYRLSIANNFNFWLEKVKTDQGVDIEVSEMMQTGQARDLSEFIETSFADYTLRMHAKFHYEKEREQLFGRQDPRPPSTLPAGQAARQEDMPFHSEVEAHKNHMRAAKP
ncbi:hypothetical protein DL766_003638 [Monosporascus sp. MC13-8B]|uniref:Uncharacterized protein n=1 Tax=Monosporascus cannonballus TaxID=155416 RepID=A0ABY0H6B1_9PEZI|nr:hypothetical protein DL762_004923 [Monosporascus cannonballus]RYO91561.1 hypothetical protein DL763_004942 [Monosporascus cannonballus]RYP33138.1 hypothetical protein DL766_003638 [Monosporascus sp. MC13-8B]